MKKLSNEAKTARAQYLREWRKKNPAKVKEYERRHWEKKAAELKAKGDCRFE